MSFPQGFFRNAAAFCLCAILIPAAILLFCRYLLPLLFPLLLAWMLALLLQSPVRRLERRHIPRKLTVPVLEGITVSALTALVYFVVRRAYAELSAFAQTAGGYFTRLAENAEFRAEEFARLGNGIPLRGAPEKLEELWHSAGNALEEGMTELLSFVTGNLIPLLGSVLSLVPQVIFILFVVLMTAYYLAVDFEKIERGVSRLLPHRVRPVIQQVNQVLRTAVGKFLHVYGLLLGMTFAELFFAFLILGIPGGFLLAVVIAFVDILPVLGTGTVLVPWAIVCFCTGNTGRGIGLALTYLIITVVREILEPRLVGKSTGISPLAAVVGMYLGLKTAGIAGLLLFPLAWMLVRSVWDGLQNAGIFKKNETS